MLGKRRQDMANQHDDPTKPGQVSGSERFGSERPKSERIYTEHELDTDQATQPLDPNDVTSDANHPIEEMNIDAARLIHQATEQTRMAMIVTDPHEPDDPIVFVNQAFERMTGYARDEIIGQNCRFLQGKDTDPRAVRRIREGLEREEVTVIELLNYRKDGSPFWNTLHVGPIYDEDGRLTHHYGSQWDVTHLVEARERHAFDRRVMEELRHRTGNLFAVIGAIVNLSAQGATDVTQLVSRVEGRIRALAQAHEVSLASAGEPREKADLHALVEAIMRPYRGSGGRLELGGTIVELPPTAVTPLGMTLHELATNAVKYGPLGQPNGTVRVAWTRDGDRLHIEWTETGKADERSVPEPDTPGTGIGSNLMRGILSSVQGSIETEMAFNGLRARLTVPLDST